MLRKLISIVGAAMLLLGLSACHNKRVSNPIADLNSKQPDKILFDRAMDAMKHNKYDVARLTLQTLINTYPDSEYVARAKLAVGDSWYAEGTSAALVQAENEYKDFETFFPNMPEAAEAQLKIANIHFRQMEKPDRDFTHAKRAEEEYRQLMLQYPDSKLVPIAKERLLQVQEVLAEREFRVGRFYYLRESWPAAIARLRSLADTYPLYSNADDTLYLLGSAYERQVETIRAAKAPEAYKGKLIAELQQQAAEAYSRIITRYPIAPRAEDAKKRLLAMHHPVPMATEDAIALNKREEESRRQTGIFGRMMGNFHRGPDMAASARVGDPTLNDPKQTSAPDIVRENSKLVMEAATAAAGSAAGNKGKVSVEVVKDGTPPPSEAVPRSDADASAPAQQSPATMQQTSPPVQQPAGGGDSSGIPELQPLNTPAAGTSSGPLTQTGQAETKQPVGPQNVTPQTPPDQVNEVKSEASDRQDSSQPAAASNSSSDKDKNDSDSSSSKSKKKKKGLKKLIPF